METNLIIIINEKKEKSKIFFSIINCVLLIRQLYSEIKMVKCLLLIIFL